MKLFYGRNQQIGGNLGDELNLYLWPKLFKRIFQNKDSSISFLGIGSVLSADPTYNVSWINSQKKIVFGTGVRPYSKVLNLDDTYDVYFLRGPLSTMYLGIDNKFAITDAAYCIQFIDEWNEIKNVTKSGDIGIIPHFQSMKYVDWEYIAKELGYKLISPICECDNILEKLKEIASCKYVMCEAMHGAILADILRVPWARFVFGTYRNESSSISDFKWMDWMFSIKVRNVEYLHLPLTNKINNGIKKISNGRIALNSIFKYSITSSTIKRLSMWSPNYSLSKEDHLRNLNDQLEEKIYLFKGNYANSLRPISGSHSN